MKVAIVIAAAFGRYCPRDAKDCCHCKVCSKSRLVANSPACEEHTTGLRLHLRMGVRCDEMRMASAVEATAPTACARLSRRRGLGGSASRVRSPGS